MIELVCPNCKRSIRVKEGGGEQICPKCLESYGVSYIMVESKNVKKPRNLGGGLFENPKE